MIAISFIIPAYNSALTIRHCLDSFVNIKAKNHIEVMVVNDGSTDETANITQQYMSQYPYIKLINKENGGHGSVINTATKIAQGKYFKILDSDDRILPGALDKFVHALKKIDTDVVLTHFKTLDYRTKHVRDYRMRDIRFGHVYSFEEFWKHKKNVSKVFHLHGITYKTDFYTDLKLELTERISYEDQEFTTLPFAKQPTIMPLNLALEEYSIGNTGQSTSGISMSNKLPQLEMVFWKLEDAAFENLPAIVKDYVFHKRREFLLVCYMAMYKGAPRKDIRRWVQSLRNQLKEKNARLYNVTRKQYNICYILSILGITDDTIAKMQKYRLYKLVSNIIS